MARKMWIVLTDAQDMLQRDEEWDSKHRLRSGDWAGQRRFGVFFRKNSATEFAVWLSQQNPGLETYVFEQTEGFSCASTPVAKKVWTPDGNYIPAAE